MNIVWKGMLKRTWWWITFPKIREASLPEEIKSNSLQMEQLSEDVRGLMYAVRDLTEQLALKEES
tara:strand:+ start:43 stop:237 length:195 start_codon:yes stop_codon:yes gene_type:complete